MTHRHQCEHEWLAVNCDSPGIDWELDHWVRLIHLSRDPELDTRFTFIWQTETNYIRRLFILDPD